MAERKNGTRAKIRGGHDVSALKIQRPPFVRAINRLGNRAIDLPGIDPEARRIFVLDTNVLMHDPSCLFRFQEHDVFITMMTLDELDNHKKGKDDINRSVREVLRTIKEMSNAKGCKISEGIDLSGPSEGLATGRLYFQTGNMEGELPVALPMSKVDHQILSVITYMQGSDAYKGCLIILVTKDINMYIKAKALGYMVEDYLNDMVIEDTDLLYSGALELPDDFWDRHGKGIDSWRQGPKTYHRVTGKLCPDFLVNEFVWIEGEGFTAIVKEKNGKTAVLESLTDYTHQKNAVWGITARNREQNFALNLLMNPEIDFVTLLGPPGTGKTLLTIAAALAQKVEKKMFAEIIMTRVTVPVGEDIGFLPGTEEEKMDSWMGARDDNLEVLTNNNKEDIVKDNGSYKSTRIPAQLAHEETISTLKQHIKVKSLNFMRGRSFLKKYLIIDEAQNLTSKQMKTLITRAGPGTKVICLGNIGQIDTPYLTEGSSGLTYVVDRFKGWPHSGHVILQRGERSRLADHATEVL